MRHDLHALDWFCFPAECRIGRSSAVPFHCHSPQCQCRKPVSWIIRRASVCLCHLHVPTVWKYGSLSLLEPSGPAQTCAGIPLPFYLYLIVYWYYPCGTHGKDKTPTQAWSQAPTQEGKCKYLSHCYCYLPLSRQVAITVWQIPDAVYTVVCAPDDGCRYNPKYIKQFPDLNKVYKVASHWIYSDTSANEWPC